MLVSVTRRRTSSMSESSRPHDFWRTSDVSSICLFFVFVFLQQDGWVACGWVGERIETQGGKC